AWISDRWLARIGGYHDNNWMRIIRLLRFGFSGLPAELSAPLLVAFYLCFLYVMSFVFPFMSERKSGQSHSIFFQFVILLLMAGSIGGENLAQRRPRLAMELLWPLRRSRLVDALLAASAWNASVWCCVINVCILFV